MAKPDRETIMKAIPRAALRLLPVGALLLPLCTLATRVIFKKTETRFYITTLLGALLHPEQTSAFVNNTLRSEPMADTRAWVYVAIAGLAVGVVCALAGFAFLFAKKAKALFACACVYCVGAPGGASMVLGLVMASRALALAMQGMGRLADAGLTLEAGVWALAAALLLNLIACLVEWRRVKERERLDVLVHRPKRKREE